MKNKEAKSIFSSLENFSSIPPPELWDKIEAQLDQPKKKKRAIIWWSVAASLVVGVSVSTTLYFKSNQENGIEINMGNGSANINDDINTNINGNIKGKSNINGNSNELVLQKDSEGSSNSRENLNSNVDGSKNDVGSNVGNDIVNDNASNASKSKLNNNRIHLNNSNQVAAVTVLTISSKTKERKGIGNLKQSKNSFANPAPKEESKTNTIVSNENSTSAISKLELVVEKSIQVSNSNSNNKSVVGNQNNNISGLNINSGTTANTSSKDSLNKIKMEVAQLESALVQLDKDKNKKKKDPASIDKWSLQVFAGVMSSQNYNNEKALGNTVASKQSGGYGVKTNYKLNKKWGVSSGFKINELGQKIAGVSYYEQQSYSGILKESLPVASDGYQMSSSKNNYGIVFISNNQDYMFASNSNADNGFEKGDVTQNLKYFEMPLEVSYALLSKKKTSITMNTGGFVGMLISNDLLLDGNSIGENKNVNQYVYGTLLSSTLQYEFYKKTKFFIEPGMNYYINPLENQSFNQFQLMFNVGLNISF